MNSNFKTGFRLLLVAERCGRIFLAGSTDLSKQVLM